MQDQILSLTLFDSMISAQQQLRWIVCCYDESMNLSSIQYHSLGEKPISLRVHVGVPSWTSFSVCFSSFLPPSKKMCKLGAGVNCVWMVAALWAHRWLEAPVHRVDLISAKMDPSSRHTLSAVLLCSGRVGGWGGGDVSMLLHVL